MNESNNPMFTEPHAREIWETYLKQVDALCGSLDGARLGSGTRNLFHLLRINAFKSLKQFMISMLMGFGYLLSFYFFITAVMKLFYPQYVGLYITETGWPFIGYVDAEGFTELLGYWLTPVGLAAAIALQWCLNMYLRRRSNPTKR